MVLTDSHLFDTASGEQTLRPLGWSELCARLVAAQDLRRDQRRASFVLPDVAGTHVGSFHPVTALMLESVGWHEEVINPDVSSYGKQKTAKLVDSNTPPMNPQLGAPGRRDLP